MNSMLWHRRRNRRTVTETKQNVVPVEVKEPEVVDEVLTEEDERQELLQILRDAGQNPHPNTGIEKLRAKVDALEDK